MPPVVVENDEDEEDEDEDEEEEEEEEEPIAKTLIFFSFYILYVRGFVDGEGRNMI